MAIKRKKLLAAIMAAAVLIAAIPTASLMASSLSDTETTEASTEDTAVAEDATTEDTTTEDAATEAAESEDTAEESDAVDESEWVTLDDYELIETDSTEYDLYYYEPRLSIILVNKETGEMIESTLSDEKNDGVANQGYVDYMQSGIVITAIIGTISTYQVDMNSVENEIETTYIDNGLSAEIYWESYGFRVTVEITLENDNELVVNIPSSEIEEEKADDAYYINAITVFPFMGYTYMDEQDGYMLLPDGNGALVYLDDKEGRYSTGYSQMVYGTDAGLSSESTTETLLWDKYDIVTDANQIIAPIFGMAHLDDQLAYLAVIESGDTRAYIEALPNGAILNYNRIYAKFIYREVYVQPLNNSSGSAASTVNQAESVRTQTDATVRYFLLSGDDANYSGMANIYREYLLENDLVSEADTSYNTRVDFLGTDRESFLFGTTAVVATSVENIEDIYEQLQAKGISSLLTVYKGWQKGGLYNVPISKYKADSKIGGTSALTELIEDSEKSNYHIYLYNDALEINATTNVFTFNAMKKINKRTYSIDTHQQVYDTFYYQMPSKSSSGLTSFVKSYTSKGVDTLAVAGISNTLFSYTSQGSVYSRQNSADTYEKVLSSVSEDTSLILEEPSAYLWKYTEAFLDMPLGSSDFMYVDEEIPFLSMVLKGIIPMYSEYVNFEANKSEFFLQMVESGVYPSFYLTYENSSALIYTNSSDLYSTEYTTYMDTVTEYDEQLRALAKQTEGSYIISHEITDEGIRKVTYDNGVVIYVNYTDNDIDIDGLTVGAMSYKVGEAE